jgi:hypothetical protein
LREVGLHRTVKLFGRLLHEESWRNKKLF